MCIRDRLDAVAPDGAVLGNVMGTYLHGLFDSGELTVKLAELLLRRKGVDPAQIQLESRDAYRQRQYDILAQAVRQSLDMAALYRAMEDFANG